MNRRLASSAAALALAVSPLVGCQSSGDPAAAERARLAQIHVGHAEAALKGRDYLRAALAADEALAVDPLDPALRQLVQRVRLTTFVLHPNVVVLDRAAELAYQAEVLEQLDGGHAHVYKTARGLLRLAAGDAEGAEKLIQPVAGSKADWSPVQVALGRVRLRQGQRDEAIKLFEKALELDKTDHSAREELGAALVAGGQHDQAIPLLQEAIKAQDGVLPRRSLAVAYLSTNRPKEAGAHIERAVQLNPRDGESQRILGEYYLATEALERAAEAYRQASQLGAEPLASFGLATVLQRQGDLQRAAQLYAAVYDAAPQLSIAAFQAAAAAEQLGRPDIATELYARYVEAAKDDEAEAARLKEARVRLARLRSGLDQQKPLLPSDAAAGVPR